MSRCLAFDASTEKCSAAIINGSQMTFRESDEPRSHANHLLVMAESLLADNKLQLTDLDFIAVSKGPGSFTGLRIAFSMAQGLAYACSLPLLGVTSLDAMAALTANELQSNANLKHLILSVLDARMSELYWTAHELDQNGLKPLVAPTLSDAQSLTRFLSEQVQTFDEVSIAGPGADLIEVPTDVNEGVKLNLVPQNYPNAQWVAQLAARQWDSGAHTSAEELQLLYLRNSVAWEKRKKLRT